MDLKPGNVVITRDWDAVLIDVSGIGGFTYEWLSPEMVEVDDVLSQPLASRKFNDIWALGRMFGGMACVLSDEADQELLRRLGLAATVETPASRIHLDEIISRRRKLVSTVIVLPTNVVRIESAVYDVALRIIRSRDR